jgi:hypothetical protein
MDDFGIVQIDHRIMTFPIYVIIKFHTLKYPHLSYLRNI